jgi:ubiquitin-protein ligase
LKLIYRNFQTNPDVKVYVNSGNISQWKVFIKGPEDSPYKGRTWYLLVTFPPDYPAQAPILRFITLPHHINVSAEGLICMPLLGQWYTPYVTVEQLILAVQDLLLSPRQDFSVQVGTFWNAVNDPLTFKAVAQASGKRALAGEGYLEGVTIDDDPSYNPIPGPNPETLPVIDDESPFAIWDEGDLVEIGDDDVI